MKLYAVLRMSYRQEPTGKQGQTLPLKGRGFHLHKSGLREPELVSRLLYAVALAYIWLVFLGKLAIDTPWHKRIHRNDRCDLSLFQLGKRLLKLFLRENITIPNVLLTS